MAQASKEIKTVRADCEECGAEVLITVLYAPPFRDLSPVCPFCHFPLTKLDADEVAQRIKRLQSYAQEVAA